MNVDQDTLGLYFNRMGMIGKTSIVCFVLLCVTLSVILIWQMKQHNVVTKGQSARKAGKPLPVHVYQVNSGDMNYVIPTECTLKESALIPVNSKNRYSEKIRQTFVKVNDRVKKNQLLIELDTDVEMMELQEAERHLAWLKKEEQEGHRLYFNWSKNNREKGVGLEKDYLKSKVDWLRARSQVYQAEYDKKIKQLRINQKIITAPVSGVVVHIAPVGQSTLVNKDGLVSLAVIDPILFICSIGEEKINQLTSGLLADISIYSHPGKRYQGEIAYISPIADAEARTISAFIRLANTDSTLIPGLHGIARINIAKTALRIPSSALINSPAYNQAQVFVVDATKRVALRTITTGIYVKGYTEVIAGLQNDEKVVVAGQYDLKSGDSVSIVGMTSTIAN